MAGKRLTSEQQKDKLLNQFWQRKEKRDSEIAKLLKQFRSAIEAIKTFNDSTAELGASYRELAIEQLIAEGRLKTATAFDQHDSAILIRGLTEQLAINDGTRPFNGYLSDSSLESNVVLSALGQFANIAIQQPPREPMRFVVVRHDGSRELTY